MTLVTRLRLLVAGLLMLSLSGTALSLWSVREAVFELERVNLAHGVYDGYLSLSSHTYQLFKQYGDALLVGNRDLGLQKNNLIDEIRADIAGIRRLIGEEIDFVGEEEIEELELVAAIEIKLEQLITGLERIAANPSADTPATHWQQLSRMLDDDIDRDFRAIIEEALAGEQDEVAETRAAAHARLVRYQRLALAFAALGLAAVVGSIWVLHRGITHPAERLLAGAMRFSEGDFDHRIRLGDASAFGLIGDTLDRMAESLAAESTALASQNAELDDLIRRRTRKLESLLGGAKRADANRRRMLADVSHELRTPVTIIKGEADVALRGASKAPEVYRDALVRTRDAAEHTAQLIDDLLFVARSEAGEVRLRLEQVELVGLLDDVVRTFDPEVELAVDLAHAVIRGDAGRVRQAVLVLLDNARRHGGAHVRLRLDATPDGYRVAVEDDGPGMSDIEKAQAFQRFFRGSNATARYGDGLGLGLPIALAVAEAHGGSVMLEDRPEGGLVAALLLPRRPRLQAVS